MKVWQIEKILLRHQHRCVITKLLRSGVIAAGVRGKHYLHLLLHFTVALGGGQRAL